MGRGFGVSPDVGKGGLDLVSDRGQVDRLEGIKVVEVGLLHNVGVDREEGLVMHMGLVRIGTPVTVDGVGIEPAAGKFIVLRGFYLFLGDRPVDISG